MTTLPAPPSAAVPSVWAKLARGLAWHRVPATGAHGGLRRRALCGYSSDGRRWQLPGAPFAGTPTEGTSCPRCAEISGLPLPPPPSPPLAVPTPLPAGMLRQQRMQDRDLAARGIDVAADLPQYDPAAVPRPPCGKCGARFTVVEPVTHGALHRWTWHCLMCGWEGGDFVRVEGAR